MTEGSMCDNQKLIFEGEDFAIQDHPPAWKLTDGLPKNVSNSGLATRGSYFSVEGSESSTGFYFSMSWLNSNLIKSQNARPETVFSHGQSMIWSIRPSYINNISRIAYIDLGRSLFLNNTQKMGDLFQVILIIIFF